MMARTGAAPPKPTAPALGHPVPGRFVTLEGIDGSGKSSALKHIVQALANDGLDVWATREETTGPTGDLVRRAVAEHWPPVATAILFAGDRAVHVADIQKRLGAGQHVVCDRYLHSTLAYQSITLRGLLPDPHAWLRAMHDGWCPMPDRVILFDSHPEKAVARAAGRGQTTPYEKLAFLQEVAQAYRALAKADAARFVVLDADRPMGELAADALAAARLAIMGPPKAPSKAGR